MKLLKPNCQSYTLKYKLKKNFCNKSKKYKLLTFFGLWTTFSSAQALRLGVINGSV